MRKIPLTVILFVASFGASGQKPDTTYIRKDLARTDIQLLFSYYGQDGNHSAVTGGTGTEQLTVYAPEIGLQHHFNAANRLDFNAGVDVITSASTDNIDFEFSSASRRDKRAHANLGYSHFFKKSNMTLGGSSAFSMESDYLSWGGGLSLSHLTPSRSREIGLSFQAFFDDLRWGRLDDDYRKPVTLVYPSELRYKEWFNIYKRLSFNVEASIYQVVNRRLALAFYPGLVYQQGLLSTPFHRVFFNDFKTTRVENLPDRRLKIPLGIQANAFVGGRWIVRAYYRWYWDDYGIRAHTFDLETPVKLTPSFTLSPFCRFYTQTASTYFKPYREHTLLEGFYTSDYDLSEFQSLKIGLGLRYAPFKKIWKRVDFNAVELRYAWYSRTDGLSAHLLTLFWEGGLQKKSGQEYLHNRAETDFPSF